MSIHRDTIIDFREVINRFSKFQRNIDFVIKFELNVFIILHYFLFMIFIIKFKIIILSYYLYHRSKYVI